MTVTEVEEAITLSYHGAEELEVQEFSWRFTTGESSLEVAKKYSTRVHRDMHFPGICTLGLGLPKYNSKSISPIISHQTSPHIYDESIHFGL